MNMALNMKEDLEPPLRFAITGAQNAVQYISRLPRHEGDDDIADAIEHFNAAASSLREYARQAGVEIRQSMKT